MKVKLVELKFVVNQSFYSHIQYLAIRFTNCSVLKVDSKCFHCQNFSCIYFPSVNEFHFD